MNRQLGVWNWRVPNRGKLIGYMYIEVKNTKIKPHYAAFYT